MAVVGDAQIIVRAITTNVASDIQNGFRGLDKIGSSAGKNVTNSFNKELKKLGDDTSIARLHRSLGGLAPGAQAASKAFHSLVRTGFFLQSGMGALAGSLGAVVGGIGALIGVAGGAAPAIVALGGAFGSLIVGMQVAKGAFKGIGSALSQLQKGGGGGGQNSQKAIEDAMKSLAQVVEANQKKIVAANNRIRQAQLNLNAAFKAGREEIQQLGFEAESAALGEKKAAIDLEKAREELARAQDLPPNSRARREAELAFQEAELNYRQAKDRNSDLAAEQERLAKSGVEGTDAVISARQELADAEENLRDTVVESLRAQEDAQNRLNDAINNKNGGGGADPLKGLTESQKVFVNYLYKDVLPALFTLKEAASDSFLPVLQQQMERMFSGGLFERLRDGIEGVSKGLAVAVTNFTDVLMQESVLEDFSSFFRTSAELLPRFGTIFGNVFGSVLTLLDAVAPVTKNFVGFLESKSAAFKNFLDVRAESGLLTGFFYRASELAARFGDVFGNIFGGIGKMIQSNIGPGSGGDMLLTWLQTATQGFANMDTTALTMFFKGTSANLISMMDTLGNFFSAIIAAGADPAVSKFWEILQSGIGTFRHVVMESVKTAPFLATIAQRLGEILAIFMDSGSITAFLDVFGYVVAGFENLFRAMQPLLNILGPVFAAISAVAMSLKLMNNGFKIIVGTIMAVTGPIKSLTTFLIQQATAVKLNAANEKLLNTERKLSIGTLFAQATASKAVAAAERDLKIARLEELVELRAQQVSAAALNVQRMTEIGTTRQVSVAKAQLVLANQAATAAEVELGVAAGGAGAAIWAAMAPLLPILLAVGAAVAVAFAYSAQQQANFEKATASITAGFESGADAVDLYNSSLLAVDGGPVKRYLADSSGGFANLKDTIDDLDVVQDNFFVSFFGSMIPFEGTIIKTTSVANAFGAVGKSLANLAADDLPAAQKGFKDYTAGLGLNKDQIRVVLDEMDEYKTAIMDQAKALGVDLIDAQTGNIDQMKLQKFALGEGEIAIRRYVTAAQEQLQATRDAAIAMVSSTDAYKAATTDIEGNTVDFNLEGYFTSLEAQITAAQTFVTNMTTATQMGLSAQSQAFINSTGADGQVLLQSIVDAGPEAVARMNANMEALHAETSSQLLLSSSEFNSAISNIAETYGDDAAKAIVDGVTNATLSAEEAAKGLGITIDGLDPTLMVEADTNAVSEALGNLVDGKDRSVNAIKNAAKDKPKIDADTAPINTKMDAAEQRMAAFSATRWTTTIDVQGGSGWAALGNAMGGEDQKNGGLMKYANGGIAKFANGMLRGAGGPRDDRIPAMLSAGEYVVNAMATKRYLPLLQQINSGSPTFDPNQTQGAGAGTSIQITVNPSPGMDEKALAFAVSRELAFQMRKGSM